ncbi:MAG TPA: hypothetical protein PL041_05020 [Melioribacteraceae bacterium]|nr:hypothetical protein [Melioribacteraceae bacterium]
MKLFLLVIFLFNVTMFAQLNPLDIYSKITTKEARKEFKENQVKFIEDTFVNISDSLDYEKLSSAFWAMELINYKTDNIKEKIEKILINYSNHPLNFKRSLLQIIYSMYPFEFVKSINKIIITETNDKLFAMCANYLKRTGYNNNKLNNIMIKNFPKYNESPILFMLSYNLKENNSSKPSVKDLIKHNVKNNYPVIYSFQRKNRNYQGIAVIKMVNGKLLMKNENIPFYIKQLARAVTNLPGYLTNGNTPQGIFSFQDFGASKNMFIGPTPTVQLVLPYEVTPDVYFKDSLLVNTEWSLDMYKNLLPASWQNYTPIFEAYYAGKAGRNEIISHGTTVDPTYYKEEPFFPNTPTYGCLCAYEVWDPFTGGLIQSDQLELDNAIINYGFAKGFVIVVELDDQEKDVTLEEVVKLFE